VIMIGRPAEDVARYDRVVFSILERIHKETTISVNRLSVFQDAIFINNGSDEEYQTLERIMRENAKERGLEVVDGKWRKVK
jgi:hypothetical protein